MNTPLATRFWLTTTLALGLALGHGEARCQSDLYTEGPGTNPPFAAIRDSIANGFSGTTIDVNNDLVEGGLYGAFGVQSDLKIHTLASSSVGEHAHDNWSRWYQTDGATQVFRLFPGEENVRNSRPLAARIEAFDANTGWNVDDGEWNNWVARYTIIKPINAAIFQAKDRDDEAWSVHLNMTDSGSVYVQHRRPLPGQEKRQLLIENAIGQPFDVRVRDNGLDYEVYLGNQSEPFTAGQYVRNAEPGDNSDTRFRWGIYVGAKEVESEALVLVSHATVNPDIDFVVEPEPIAGSLIAGWETWREDSADTWIATQSTGVTAEAVGYPEAGGVFFNFSNAVVANGASGDGQYGLVGPSEANTAVAAPSDGVTLSNGFDGFIDFTLTDITGAERDLTGFHFDIGAFRPDAATDWQLEVLDGGDLTAGALATGTAAVAAGPIADDESIDLTNLADSTLDANGSVTFRLSFTGGGGDAGSAASGHHLFLDNVGVTALEQTLAGDFDESGSINVADYTLWTSTYGSQGDLRADGNGDGVVDGVDYAIWRENYEATLGEASSAVPEPAAVVVLTGAVLVGLRRSTRSSQGEQASESFVSTPAWGMHSPPQATFRNRT